MWCDDAGRVAFGALGRVYMPWRGKVFDATAHSGRNLFTARSKLLIRPFDPAVRDDRPGLVLAYPFATSSGPGVIDRDREVLKIDYDLPTNPFGPLRRVLDELVEVAPGYYLVLPGEGAPARAWPLADGRVFCAPARGAGAPPRLVQLGADTLAIGTACDCAGTPLAGRTHHGHCGASAVAILCQDVSAHVY